MSKLRQAFTKVSNKNRKVLLTEIKLPHSRSPTKTQVEYRIKPQEQSRKSKRSRISSPMGLKIVSKSRTVSSLSGKKSFYRGIQEKLLLDLEEHSSKAGLSSEMFTIYQNAFNQVIENDRTNSLLLLRIKSQYDQFICKQQEEIQELKNTVQRLESLLVDEKDTYKKLNKRYRDLAFDHIQLSNTIEKMNMEKTNRSERGFNDDLATDLKKYNRKTKDKLLALNKKYQEIKLSNFKFSKAFDALRAKGYPVDTIIEEISPLQNEKLWLQIPSYQEYSLNSSFDSKSYLHFKSSSYSDFTN